MGGGLTLQVEPCCLPVQQLVCCLRHPTGNLPVPWGSLPAACQQLATTCQIYLAGCLPELCGHCLRACRRAGRLKGMMGPPRGNKRINNETSQSTPDSSLLVTGNPRKRGSAITSTHSGRALLVASGKLHTRGGDPWELLPGGTLGFPTHRSCDEPTL